MLRPLLDHYDANLIRRTGLQMFGFPPDVFGTTNLEFCQLSAALLSMQDSKPSEGKVYGNGSSQ
jgi:hypothetical protein